MSSLVKMSIQGIRSFGPDDKDKQVIKFFNPLTIIQGHNGAGKTTIIECLKYMTTGDFPPGCARGGSFVHDPKIAHETEVKGQIRLQFRDVNGQLVSVQKSMMATQKVKKVDFKTMEGVITRDKHGQRVSLSSRCAEIEREMISLLGVSKAVLTNVIFCHQEDSNWPLSEGKTLKTKFDEIFSATRYIKALEAIRKFKLDQGHTIKEHQTEIKYLKQNKEKAAEIKEQQSQTEGRLAGSKESIRQIRQELQPVEERIDKINTKANEIHQLEKRISSLQSRKTQMERDMQDLRDNLENIFSGSTEQLKRQLSEHQGQVEENEDAVRQLEMRMDQVTREGQRYGRERGDLLVKQGKLQQEATLHQQNIQDRDNLVLRLAQQLGLEGFSSAPFNDRRIARFHECMKQRIDEAVAMATSVKRDYEEQEAAAQKKVDDLRDTKTKLEQTQRLKQDMMNKNKRERREIETELSKVDASTERIASLGADLARKERELQQVEESAHIPQLKEEVLQLQNEKRQLDGQLGQLDAELHQMHLQSSVRTQLEMLRKDKVGKEDSIRKLKQRHQSELTDLMGHFPSKTELVEWLSKKQQEIAQSQRRTQKVHQEVSSLEARKKMLTEQLKKREQELDKYEEQLFDVCGSQDFDVEMDELGDHIQKLQDQKGALVGTRHLYTRFISELQKEPSCPLCERRFGEDQEVKELVDFIKQKIARVPTELNTKDQLLRQQQQKYDTMMSLKPIRKQVVDLKDHEVPDIKSKISTINQEIEQKRTQITEGDELFATLSMEEEMAKACKDDIAMIERYRTELRELEKKIAQQSSKLAGSDSGRTIEEVNSAKQDKQLQVDNTAAKLEQKRQQISDLSERINALKMEVNTIAGEKLRLESELQRMKQLEDQKAELVSVYQELQREIKGDQGKAELVSVYQELQREIRVRQRPGVCVPGAAEGDQGKAELVSVYQELQREIKVRQSWSAEGDQGKAELVSVYQELQREIKVRQSWSAEGDQGKAELVSVYQELQREIKVRQSWSAEGDQGKAELVSVYQELQREIKVRQSWSAEGDQGKAELVSVYQELQREIRDTQEKLEPLESRLQGLRREKDDITRKKEQAVERAKNKVDQEKSRKNEVAGLDTEIDRYIEQGRDKLLQETEEKLQVLENKLKKAEDEKEKMDTRMQSLRKEVANQKARERELQDNLQLRKREEEVNKIAGEISDLEEELGGLDARSIEQEKRKLVEKQDQLLKEKYVAEGRMRGLEEEIRRYRKELQSDQFKDADVKYRDMMIVLRTTELANADLEKYYKALDRAVMSYHHMKMEEINKIIQELWRNTYRGQDIDTIEIRSAEDTTTAATKNMRRTYNYRVVMVKGETALDMRGRCSAGQKVLASLIIRLALAETFCINCGVLALDEPTTNLDRENIESLAAALMDIVKGRSRQRNFQLLVITHDEEFVDLLVHANFTQHFWRVSKDNDGLSQLVKHDAAALQD
ncbi:RAD50 [Branchiostoma lanceolatum]|uniref:RAD50 protein n=1 Tax=Branchiostoma lanceolatum TaxID=7740 RepID=A0A8K0ELQ1_BRALA|nr:RAD50 [Branchiostoma lanceolatum]